MTQQLEDKIDRLAEAVLAQHEENRHEFIRMNRSITALWRRVTGSDPPPDEGRTPPNGAIVNGRPSSYPTIPPIDEQATAGYAAWARLPTVEKKVEAIMQELGKQSHAMALDKTGWRKLFTLEGVKVVGAAVAGVASLATTIYCMWKGLPVPFSTP